MRYDQNHNIRGQNCAMPILVLIDIQVYVCAHWSTVAVYGIMKKTAAHYNTIVFFGCDIL